MSELEVHHFVGFAVCVVYSVATVLGFIALRHGCGRTMYGAIYISTTACLLFALLYPQYLATGAWVENDLIWALAHCLGGLGANFLHVAQIRGR